MSSHTISKLLEKQKLSPTTEIVDALSDISQGNPSIIWKIMNHLKEERDAGGLESVLHSMRDNTLILSLLKSCSYMQTVILKTASIIGEEFSTTILKLVLPDTILPLLNPSLEALVDSGFIVYFDDGFFGFSSSLLKKMIYDLIPQRYDQLNSSNYLSMEINRIIIYICVIIILYLVMQLCSTQTLLV